MRKTSLIATTLLAGFGILAGGKAGAQDLFLADATGLARALIAQARSAAPAIDFNGRHGEDGSNGGNGSDGENAPAVVVVLKADSALTTLEVNATAAGRALSYRLSLPLNGKIKVRAMGGDGGRGGDGFCHPDRYQLLAGRGGDGGDGAKVTVYYNQPQLLNMIEVFNRGGFAGSGGFPNGCSGGTGGSGLHGLSARVVYVQGEP